jgi:GNAT superfamily N-acetyltransferase
MKDQSQSSSTPTKRSKGVTIRAAVMHARLATSSLKIRRAKPADAKRIAELSGELGYPATAPQVSARIRALRPAALHAAFVAEHAHDGVVGWVHVSVSRLLEMDCRAEVNGLVVADGKRSQGAGAELLAAAEKWARRKKCHSVSVRSNAFRERAHRFYERHGYEHYKTQKAFRKTL